MKSLTELNALLEDCDEIGVRIVAELRKLFPLITACDDEGDIPDCAGDYEIALLGKVGSNAAEFENCTHQEIREIVEILNEMWEIVA